MTTPNEMHSAEKWAFQFFDTSDVFIHCARYIQADALSWAAEQIKTSDSLQEALLKLSLKHQELCKPKK